MPAQTTGHQTHQLSFGRAPCAAAPLAGAVLIPMCCWISIATVLTFAIWRLNGPPRMPFLPRLGENRNAPVRLRNLLQLQATSIAGTDL